MKHLISGTICCGYIVYTCIRCDFSSAIRRSSNQLSFGIIPDGLNMILMQYYEIIATARRRSSASAWRVGYQRNRQLTLIWEIELAQGRNKIIISCVSHTQARRTTCIRMRINTRVPSRDVSKAPTKTPPPHRLVTSSFRFLGECHRVKYFTSDRRVSSNVQRTTKRKEEIIWKYASDLVRCVQRSICMLLHIIYCTWALNNKTHATVFKARIQPTNRGCVMYALGAQIENKKEKLRQYRTCAHASPYTKKYDLSFYTFPTFDQWKVDFLFCFTPFRRI